MVLKREYLHRKGKDTGGRQKGIWEGERSSNVGRGQRGVMRLYLVKVRYCVDMVWVLLIILGMVVIVASDSNYVVFVVLFGM